MTKMMTYEALLELAEAPDTVMLLDPDGVRELATLALKGLSREGVGERYGYLPGDARDAVADAVVARIEEEFKRKSEGVRARQKMLNTVESYELAIAVVEFFAGLRELAIADEVARLRSMLPLATNLVEQIRCTGGHGLRIHAMARDLGERIDAYRNGGDHG